MDAERRCKNYDKEIEPSRHRIRQLECDVQSLSEALDEIKQQREEEASSSKKKTDDLAERCRLLSEDLRRSTDEKRQAELRSDQEKSSYEDYMENVATQVGQALARQQVSDFLDLYYAMCIVPFLDNESGMRPFAEASVGSRVGKQSLESSAASDSDVDEQHHRPYLCKWRSFPAEVVDWNFHSGVIGGVEVGVRSFRASKRGSSEQ